MTPQQIEAMKMALDLATMHHTDDGYAALRAKVRSASKEALAQPEQEPVACKHEWFRTGAMEPGQCRCIKCGAWNTAPPQRKPLTDEEIEKLADDFLAYQIEDYQVSGVFTFARAIEAAHGIKE